MDTWLLEPDRISHTQSMVAAQIGQTFIHPYEKTLFKTQHGRIPIDPAILAAIGHRFRAIKKKIKNAGVRSEAIHAETRNRRDFFKGLLLSSRGNDIVILRDLISPLCRFQILQIIFLDFREVFGDWHRYSWVYSEVTWRGKAAVSHHE